MEKELGKVGDKQDLLSSYERGLFWRTRQVGPSGERRFRYHGGGDGSTGMFAIDGVFSKDEYVASPPSQPLTERRTLCPYFTSPPPPCAGLQQRAYRCERFPWPLGPTVQHWRLLGGTWAWLTPTMPSVGCGSTRWGEGGAKRMLSSHKMGLLSVRLSGSCKVCFSEGGDKKRSWARRGRLGFIVVVQDGVVV